MIIKVQDFDYTLIKNLKIAKRHRGNQSTYARDKYLNIVCAFDIETTRIKEIEQSIMYVWQFQFGIDITVIGRTWDEYLDFLHQMAAAMPEETKLVIYVHNLSYEFQFLRGIYEFKTDDVFAMESRKILKCTMFDRFEYRCSYIHSNMNLKQFTSKLEVEHVKLDDFVYTEARYPWTELTEEELAYCQNDVLGLVEAIIKEMVIDGDNLYTIPLTSTGYVRRDVKRAMKSISHLYVRNITPDYEIYQMLHEAFRGGNTHANRFYSDKFLTDVKSADRSSSYPDVIVNCEFPIKPFEPSWKTDYEYIVHDLMGRRHKAVLFRATFTNIRLKNPYWGCPYLAKNKCRNIINPLFDNGRILEADQLDTTLTDVDLLIIQDEYIWDDIECRDVYHSSYGTLPKALKEVVINYYKSKTELKGVADKAIYYMKQKNKLNSIYGMMATDPVRISVLFEDDEFTERFLEAPEELLNKSNKKAFVAYQWGVWTTALARLRLEEGIELAGNNFVYADTDSVKYVGDIDWSVYNVFRCMDSTDNGAYATDINGETHYMGVFEQEDDYTEFATLGAKKYVGRHADGKLEVTIAGVNKKAGGKELESHGGIKAFKEGFIFSDAGGLEAVYNDHPPMEFYNIDGHEVPITSNVVLRESTYTLGITAEYERLLNLSKFQIDKILRSC